MRFILIGCEYVGKTTLADALEEWGKNRNRPFHMDDSDFSIPDDRHLSEADQKAMIALPPAIKERFQRFQVYYHLGILENYEDCILGGFHIQEAIYGPRYYYPDLSVTYTRRVETKMPSDAILVLMTAAPDAIRSRMEEAPHRYPIVPPQDVEEVQAQFEQEFTASWLGRKLRFDTTDFGADEILDRFLEVVEPQLSDRDLLLLSRS